MSKLDNTSVWLDSILTEGVKINAAGKRLYIDVEPRITHQSIFRMWEAKSLMKGEYRITESALSREALLRLICTPVYREF